MTDSKPVTDFMVAIETNYQYRVLVLVPRLDPDGGPIAEWHLLEDTSPTFDEAYERGNRILIAGKVA